MTIAFLVWGFLVVANIPAMKIKEQEAAQLLRSFTSMNSYI